MSLLVWYKFEHDIKNYGVGGEEWDLNPNALKNVNTSDFYVNGGINLSSNLNGQFIILNTVEPVSLPATYTIQFDILLDKNKYSKSSSFNEALFSIGFEKGDAKNYDYNYIKINPDTEILYDGFEMMPAPYNQVNQLSDIHGFTGFHTITMLYKRNNNGYDKYTLLNENKSITSYSNNDRKDIKQMYLSIVAFGSVIIRNLKIYDEDLTNLQINPQLPNNAVILDERGNLLTSEYIESEDNKINKNGKSYLQGNRLTKTEKYIVYINNIAFNDIWEI